MKILKELGDNFIAFFRMIFLYHYTSLEFRAKLLAVMMHANEGFCGKCEAKILSEVANEIYDTEYRANALIDAAKKYVATLEENKKYGERYWIRDLQDNIKRHKRFLDKIDTVQLRRFTECTRDEELLLYQERILEFFDNLKKEGA